MTSTECSGSRTRNAASTRIKILTVARECFAANSYDNVGLREIASGAGVDPALINRYFGSKEALFAESLRHPSSDLFFEGVTAQSLPDYLARVITSSHPDDPERVQWLHIVLHSASSPQAARLAHDTMREHVIEPVANMLSGEDTVLRANLLLSIVMGRGVVAAMGADDLRETGDGPLRTKLRNMFVEALR